MCVYLIWAVPGKRRKRFRTSRLGCLGPLARRGWFLSRQLVPVQVLCLPPSYRTPIRSLLTFLDLLTLFCPLTTTCAGILPSPPKRNSRCTSKNVQANRPSTSSRSWPALTISNPEHAMEKARVSSSRQAVREPLTFHHHVAVLNHRIHSLSPRSRTHRQTRTCRNLRFFSHGREELSSIDRAATVQLYRFFR